MGRRATSELERERGRDLGLRVAQARRDRGWTQRDLASAAGLDLDAVRGLEQGRYAHPSFFNVVAALTAVELALEEVADEFKPQARGR